MIDGFFMAKKISGDAVTGQTNQLSKDLFAQVLTDDSLILGGFTRNADGCQPPKMRRLTSEAQKPSDKELLGETSAFNFKGCGGSTCLKSSVILGSLARHGLVSTWHRSLFASCDSNRGKQFVGPFVK